MLFVYENIEKRKRFKEQYNNYNFVGLSFFLRESDNLNDILHILQKKNFIHFIVDITNLIRDGNYFKVYTERLLWFLENYIEDVHFCINEMYLDEFMLWFPDFINEEDIDKTFSKTEEEQGIPNKKTVITNYKKPCKIYVYDKIQTMENLDKKRIVPISELIEKYEGIYLRYNIEDIEKKLRLEEIDFIDISSITQAVELRNDILLQSEILFWQITTVYNKSFCIKRDYICALEENFPFIFTEIVEIEERVEEPAEDKKIEGDNKYIDINKIANEINNVLKGHDDFKKDFKRNLLKYSFLNSIGERRIFSIMICGESGIGKTEFAKIVSKKLYPDEELIKINFGNYSTEGVLNSLIGSPLGYVGSEEGGELINKIEKSKSKVILIDEFEKATKSVYNFFYELLEDGVFTDRHGKKHDLNGYMIVFTSNMHQEIYQDHIPDSLKSRFDMVYYFVGVPKQDKLIFIHDSAIKLIDKLKINFGREVNFSCIKDDLEALAVYNNLRDIKRKVEDIVFQEFFEGKGDSVIEKILCKSIDSKYDTMYNV